MQSSNLLVHSELWGQIVDESPTILASSTVLMEAIARLGQLPSHQPSPVCPDQSVVTSSTPDCLLVVNGDRFIGMLSSQDIVRRIAAGGDWQQQTLADLTMPPIVTWTITAESNIADISQYFREPHLRYLPVLDAHDRVIGVISAHQYLHSLLHHPAIEPLQHIEQLQAELVARNRAEEEVRLLKAVTDIMVHAPDFDTALAGCLKTVCEATDWCYGEAWIPDSSNSYLTCASIWCCDAQNLKQFKQISYSLKFPIGVGLPGRVWQSQQPEWNQDVSSLPHTIFLRTNIAEENGIAAGLGVPVISEGTVLAVLVFFAKTTRPEDQRLIDLVLGAAANLGTVMQCKRTEDTLRRSETKQLALLSAIPDMMFRYSREGIHLSFIPSQTSRPIVPEAEFLGKNVTEILPAEVAQEIISAIQQALHTEETQVCEYQLMYEGELRDYEARIVACGTDEAFAIVRDITEQVQALQERQQLERELQGTLQKLTFHVDNSPLAVIEWEHDFRVCRWSQAAEDIFGWQADAVIGKHPREWELACAEDVEAFCQNLQRLPTDENNSVYETCHHHPNGEVVYCEWYNSALLDESGNLISILSLVLDISERKRIGDDRQRSEAALTASEAKWRSLIQNSSDVVMITDPTDRIAYISASVKRVLGYQPDELVNTIGFENVHPEDQAFIIQAFSDLVEQPLGAISQVVEYRYRHKQGAWVYLESIGTNLLEDPAVAGIVVNCRDITDRKAAESALRESEQKRSLHIQQTPIGVIECDPNANIIAWNPAAISTFGYSRSEAIGRNVTDLLTPERFKSHIRHILHNLLTIKGSIHSTNENLTKTGKLIICEWYSTAVVNNSGVVIGVTILVQEITERVRTEEALRRTKAELELRVDERTAELSQANEQLRLWEQAINASSNGIVIVDAQRPDMPIISTNPAFEHLTGYSTAEVKGKNCRFLQGTQPNRTAIATLRSAIATQTGCTVTLRNYRKDGTFFWNELSISPIFNDNGLLTHYVGIQNDITERILSEQALRRQLAAIEAAIDGIAILNAQGEYIYLNQTHVQLFGYTSASQLIGQTWQYLYEPDEIHRLEQEVFPIVKETGRWRGETIAKRVDGSTFSQEVSLTLVEDDGLVCVCRDISDRKRNELDRKRAEERLRLFESAVVNARDAVVITDADLNLPGPRIVYVNQAFTQITGYQPEEVIGQTPRILQGSQTKRTQLDKIRSALAQQQPAQVELRNYRKDGSDYWVDLNLVPIHDTQGTCTHWVAVHRDITERKSVEQTLLATQARLKYLLSSSPTVIYTRKPCSSYATTFISENITALLGYKAWDFLKSPTFWLNHIHPNDIAPTVENFNHLLAQDDLVCEYRFQHKDGTYLWLQDSLKLLRDSTGTPVEIIGSIVNISDRRQAEEELKASLHEKEVMLKEIHHRVKNNLQVISSLLKLQAGYIKDKQTLDILKESQNRVRAMALIHEKLYQSKDLANTDFAEYIRNLTADIVRSYGKSHNTQLRSDVTEMRLSIDAAIPCGLIINELVSNSLKYAFPPDYTSEQINEINIQLDIDTQGNYILTIADNGVGLPDELDFRDTASLGLQLVCTLTEQLKGTIELERTHGTQFTLTFADLKHKHGS